MAASPTAALPMTFMSVYTHFINVTRLTIPAGGGMSVLCGSLGLFLSLSRGLYSQTAPHTVPFTTKQLCGGARTTDKLPRATYTPSVDVFSLCQSELFVTKMVI